MKYILLLLMIICLVLSCNKQESDIDYCINNVFSEIERLGGIDKFKAGLCEHKHLSKSCVISDKELEEKIRNLVLFCAVTRKYF